MFKKIFSIIAIAILLAGTFISVPASASSNYNEGGKEQSKDQKKDVEKAKKEADKKLEKEQKESDKIGQKIKEKQAKLQAKQLKSIDKRLDQVEKILRKSQEKVTKLNKNKVIDNKKPVEETVNPEDKEVVTPAEETVKPEGTEVVTPTEETVNPEDAEAVTPTEDTVNPEKTDEVVTQQKYGQAAISTDDTVIKAEGTEATEGSIEVPGVVIPVDKPKKNTKEDLEKIENELDDLEDQMDDAEDSLEDELDRLQDELKAIDKAVGENPGYIGQFKALHNQLDNITKELDVIAANSIDQTVLAIRYERIKAMHIKVDESLDSIVAVQNKVKAEVAADQTAEIKAPVKDVVQTKTWNVKFNQELDATKLSELDIVVLDEQRNLVETTIDYVAGTKTVTITPNQNYQITKTYTLYVGKKIKGNQGQNLRNSVKMDFSVK